MMRKRCKNYPEEKYQITESLGQVPVTYCGNADIFLTAEQLEKNKSFLKSETTVSAFILTQTCSGNKMKEIDTCT